MSVCLHHSNIIRVGLMRQKPTQSLGIKNTEKLECIQYLKCPKSSVVCVEHLWIVEKMNCIKIHSKSIFLIEIMYSLELSKYIFLNSYILNILYYIYIFFFFLRMNIKWHALHLVHYVGCN